MFVYPIPGLTLKGQNGIEQFFSTLACARGLEGFIEMQIAGSLQLNPAVNTCRPKE